MVNVEFDWREIRSLKTPSVLLCHDLHFQITGMRITVVTEALRAGLVFLRVTVVADVLRS